MTFFAPDRCAASQRARPMPLAPPVTTTVLPETCMDCRATVDCFTKQLHAFSALPEPPQENEDTARRHWEADEIPVKLILEVGETSSGSFPRSRAAPGNIRLSYRD